MQIKIKFNIVILISVLTLSACKETQQQKVNLPKQPQASTTPAPATDQSSANALAEARERENKALEERNNLLQQQLEEAKKQKQQGGQLTNNFALSANVIVEANGTLSKTLIAGQAASFRLRVSGVEQGKFAVTLKQFPTGLVLRDSRSLTPTLSWINPVARSTPYRVGVVLRDSAKCKESSSTNCFFELKQTQLRMTDKIIILNLNVPVSNTALPTVNNPVIPNNTLSGPIKEVNNVLTIVNTLGTLFGK